MARTQQGPWLVPRELVKAACTTGSVVWVLGALKAGSWLQQPEPSGHVHGRASLHSGYGGAPIIKTSSVHAELPRGLTFSTSY